MPLPGLPYEARNIFCIGRNYAEHARELGNAVPVEPVVFLKPTSALCHSGGEIRLPTWSARVDHEVELVLALGAGGRIAGYAVGLDLTARDAQELAKKKGLPWTVAKGFDTSAGVGPFVSAKDAGDWRDLRFSLEVDGQLRQSGDPREMLFSPERIVEYLASIFTLAEGDLVFTGTPPGVAPIEPGQRLRAVLRSLQKESELTLTVTRRG